MSTHLHKHGDQPASKQNAVTVLLKRVVTDLQRWLNSRWASGLVPNAAGLVPDLDEVCVAGDTGAPHAQWREEAQLICPIQGAGNSGVAALVALGARCDGTPYSEEDRHLADALCEHISGLLSNERLAQQVSEQLSTLEQNHQALGRLDHCQTRRIRGLEFGAQCQRAGTSGADFFDLLPRGDHGLVVAIGSIDAQGLPGGVMLGGALASVRALAHRGEPLEEIAAELNRTLWEMAPEDCFTSFLCAEIDGSRHCVRYVNAGHEPALLLRSKGSHVDGLEPTGAILGLSRRSVYKERVMLFEPGDLLAAFTDGVAEATGRSGVLRILREGLVCGVQDLAAHVLANGETAADRTIVLVRSRDAVEFPAGMESRELVAA